VETQGQGPAMPCLGAGTFKPSGWKIEVSNMSQPRSRETGGWASTAAHPSPLVLHRMHKDAQRRMYKLPHTQRLSYEYNVVPPSYNISYNIG
jgi:hypothetical protein